MSGLALLGGEPVRTRPFPAWPISDEREEMAVLEVVRSGQWWRYSMGEATGASCSESSARSKVAEFQNLFARTQGARFGIACATGTGALEVALKAIGVGAGDEVVVPPYTFIATASAPLLIGATPVFCDIERQTLNLDPTRLEQCITPRTKAIVPVHFAGLAADLDAIFEIAERHGIPVLEDACHAPGGTWKGRGLGCIGRAGTFSFQASKNITAGEGGLITTDDPEIAEICESYIWAGRKRGGAWYEHHRLGWNYRMTEFQAAILIEQLRRMTGQTARRRENGAYLNSKLRETPGIRPLAVPSYATGHAFHIYVFRFDQREFGITRKTFLEALTAEGIPNLGGYAFPLYRNPMFHDPALGVDADLYADLCPNAEKACRETVWLEHRLLLGTREDVDDIVRAIQKIYELRREFETSLVRSSLPK